MSLCVNGPGMDGCAGMIWKQESRQLSTVQATLMILTPQVSRTLDFLSFFCPLNEGYYTLYKSLTNPNCVLSEMATKICADSGHWFVHPESNRTWTNYTDCKHKSNDHKRVSSNLGLQWSILSSKITHFASHNFCFCSYGKFCIYILFFSFLLFRQHLISTTWLWLVMDCRWYLCLLLWGYFSILSK